MSLLSEVCKTVFNAKLAFTSPLSSTAVASSSSLAVAARVQSYVQAGEPIILPGFNLATWKYVLGAFDEKTTTFGIPVPLGDGTSVLQLYSNQATATAPPQFTLAATVPIAGSATSDQMWCCASRDGLVYAVGSSNDNNNTGLLAVLTRPALTSQAWTQVATVTGSAPGTYFASYVSISADGSVIAAGAYGANGGVGQTTVYNFNRATGLLTLVATLVGTGAVGGSAQGYSISLSGDGLTLAVGGVYDNNSVGAAWLFANVSGTWTQMGEKLAPLVAFPGQYIGQFVALSFDGTTLALAAYSEPVCMYDLIDGAWVRGQTIYALPRLSYAALIIVTLSDDGKIMTFDRQVNDGGIFVFNRQSDGVWVQNGSIRVSTGAPLIPTTNAQLYFSGTSPTGTMFAVISENPPPAGVSFAIFQ